MFGSKNVSERQHESDISRQSKKISAVEIRLNLIEEVIKSDPQLSEAYKKAWAAASERRMKNELKCMGIGI